VALQGAWAVLAQLRPVALAKRLHVSRDLLYAYLNESRPNQPSVKLLRALAKLYREHAARLLAEADRLEEAAE
jgi:transcriptional regulator with XRE-family HTH domain